MEEEEFNEFLANIKRGRYPAGCGLGFSARQVEQIKEVLDEVRLLAEQRIARIDEYYEINIMTRLNPNL